MKRRALLGAALGAACADRRPRLNVYNWSDYVAPDTIANFEREFGVRVRYGIYESNEEMLAKAMTGNSGWDVVFPSNSFIGPMRENNLLARIDHTALRNLGNLDAQFVAASWDPGLEWCVPYMWGAAGIAYNRKLTPAPTAWRDLWSPRLRGHVTMLDDPPEVFAACLKKAGYSINATDRLQLERAREEAIRQKPVLRGYLNAEARDQLVSGDILAAQMWATTAQQALDAAPGLGFVYPEEGFSLYADNIAILREARHKDWALRFVDYLLRADVAAAIVMSRKTATANAAARALLPPAIRENPVLYPSLEVLKRGEWFQALPAAAQRLRDRYWTEIKSA